MEVPQSGIHLGDHEVGVRLGKTKSLATEVVPNGSQERVSNEKLITK